MLKLCGESIYKPLNLICKPCLETGQFPSKWKKLMLSQFLKILKKYRPTSLLPITGKVFQRLLYNKMLEFFIKNYSISQNQHGFKPSNSCINQQLFVTHEICKSFNASLDLRAMFLNISKAFDKVWH